MAVSDKDEPITAWERYDAFQILEPDINKIRPGYYKKVHIPAITLDTLYRLHGQIMTEIHIWADIEGAELLMLKGGTQLLSSGKLKWVLLETNKFPPPIEGWPTAEELYDFMGRYDYVPDVAIEDLPDNHYKNVIFTPRKQ